MQSARGKEMLPRAFLSNQNSAPHFVSIDKGYHPRLSQLHQTAFPKSALTAINLRPNANPAIRPSPGLPNVTTRNATDDDIDVYYVQSTTKQPLHTRAHLPE
jgi:hypothetical protein